ncbi:unnamed protein product [Mucor hiemalis]
MCMLSCQYILQNISLRKNSLFFFPLSPFFLYNFCITFSHTRIYFCYILEHPTMIKNYSTIQHFDSVKWKKRLIKFSHKLQRSHHNHQRDRNASMPTSATVLAAATEKFIRHTPTEIAIHSEDLTASQFANMTGIKTKRNSINSFTPDKYEDEDDEDSDEDDRDYYYSTTSVSSSSKQPCQPIMRIWDSHFWQDSAAAVGHRKSLPVTSAELSSSITSTTSMQEIASKAATEVNSHPMCRHASEPGGNKVPSMIQKGRFKIVWGNDDSLPITAPTSHCVEWKRKRAGSSSSAAI